MEFFGLQLNYRDTPVKYLLADVKHKILLLPIYSKNKPSADYAQILGQKWKKMAKIVFASFILNDTCLCNPLKSPMVLQVSAKHSLNTIGL